jgi:membrane protein insertase Oxa1/YidC/SpoIIIJ
MLFVSVGNLLHLSYLKRMAKSQLLSGWAIALGFFVLFYSSASALVVYWTLNIMVQWLIDLFVYLRESRVRSSP